MYDETLKNRHVASISEGLSAVFFAFLLCDTCTCSLRALPGSSLFLLSMPVFNLEISQWVICPTRHFKLGHFKNGLGQAMTLKL